MPRRALQESGNLIKEQENLVFGDKSRRAEDLNPGSGLLVRYNRKHEERHESLISPSALNDVVDLEMMKVNEGESIQAAIERLQAQSGMVSCLRDCSPRSLFSLAGKIIVTPDFKFICRGIVCRT